MISTPYGDINEERGMTPLTAPFPLVPMWTQLSTADRAAAEAAASSPVEPPKITDPGSRIQGGPVQGQVIVTNPSPAN